LRSNRLETPDSSAGSGRQRVPASPCVVSRRAQSALLNHRSSWTNPRGDHLAGARADVQRHGRDRAGRRPRL